MFTELHAMAKAAMLLITATAEGDQLRISISPTYPAGKAPAGATALRPLTLVGTPDELNADFAAALAVWQTPPKRSIIEQARAAAQDDADDAAPAKTTAQPAAKVVEPKEKQKGGRKAKPADEPQGDASAQPGSDNAVQDGDNATGETAAPAAPAAPAVDDAAPAAAPALDDSAPALPAADDAAPATTPPADDGVDIHTLDLF